MYTFLPFLFQRWIRGVPTHFFRATHTEYIYMYTYIYVYVCMSMSIYSTHVCLLAISVSAMDSIGTHSFRATHT